MQTNNSIFNRIKMKNLDLDISTYNTQVNKINQKGLLFTKEQTIKDVQKKHESIIARLNTNINIDKEKGGYNVDSSMENVNPLQGITNGVTINILRKEWIERGSPTKIQESKHRIGVNPSSLTIDRYKVEQALRRVKGYKYPRIINSIPVGG